MGEFIHLHNHTEFSLLDGAARVSDYVKETKKRGVKAVAITDHGNMYGALQFYTACLGAGIKPIIGCEFYMSYDLTNKHGKPDTGHLILLAKNNVGYRNLLKLNSIAFIDGYYYKPRIDYKTLSEYSEGLICLSGCIAGHLPRLILDNRMDDALEFALKLKNMFSDGDFYLEIQNHGIPEELKVIKGLTEIHNKTGIKLVATNDCHYLKKEDAEIQDILMCIQMGKTLDDPDRLKFSTNEFYYKTYDEMLEAFPDYKEALDATVEIADKCDVVIRRKVHGEMGLEDRYVLPATENFIPPYVPENGMDTYEYMRKLTFDGLPEKYPNPTKEVMDRIEYELSVIHDQGFVEYFLVVWDYINWAKTHGISVGPGRGSGAGSIVAYLMGITKVDPLKYALFFERFINKERVSMPDFDIDFDFDKRTEVIEYAKRKYHPENVSYIITFGKMQAKNAIKDVGRVLRIPYAQTDRITKLIPSHLPEGIKKPPVLAYYFGKTGKEENDKFINPELKEIYDSDDDLKRVIDIAIKLEGFPRNTSMHACGVLIAPQPVTEFVPQSRNGEEITTQYEAADLESLGLLKMDFLGLKTLTDIDKALQYIKEEHGVEINFDKMSYDDKKVFDMLGEGNTEAVFQLESGGFKNFMRELKPSGLEDIIAGVALYRPGPMDSIPTYVRNKHNPEKVEYPHDCIKDILKVTYGCIVYQEQVMQIFQRMGGYNLGQADNVRRIMGKKKVDKMAAEREKFIYGWEDPKGLKSIPGAIKLGIPKETAERVFADMESFASYAFNKSHATAYAMLTYQTAYLKCYYEVEFLTSIINNRITFADEVKRYVAYARTEGIEVLEPDINKSKTFFSVENGKIRYGLSGLKGVGINAIETMIEERTKNGDYKNLLDFVERLYEKGVVNKKSLEGLILSGAFDSFGLYRSQLMAIYESVVDKVSKDIKTKQSGQISLFGNAGFGEATKSMDKIKIPKIPEYNKETKLKFEKEIMGVYMSGHPLQNYTKELSYFNFKSSMLAPVEEIEDGNENSEEQTEAVYEGISDGMIISCGGIITNIKKILVKSNNKPMAIIDVEDLYGTFGAMLTPKVYEKYRELLTEDRIIRINGKVSIRPGKEPIIMVERMEEMKQQEEQNTVPNKTLYLKYNVKDENLNNRINLELNLYKGDYPVVIRCTQDNKAYKSPKTVSGNNLLLNELIGLIGEENVILK